MTDRMPSVTITVCGCALFISSCTAPPPVPEIRDARGDELISAEIRSTLQDDGAYGGDHILVETFHGTVLLR